MNKIFKCATSLCVIFAAVAFVGCNKESAEPQPQPQPSNGEVKIEVGALNYDSVEVVITPKSEDATYFAYLYPDTEEFMGRDEVEIYVDIRYSDYFEALLTSGTQTLKFQGLIGHSHYKVVYFEVDDKLNKVGSVLFSERITTPDAPEVFDIEITDVTGLSATINITP